MKIWVIWEHERRQVELEELFSDEFTHLQAVTYVATPAFFFKYTQKYENVELILGIDNPNQQHRVHRYFLDAKKITKDWEQLSEKVKHRIQSEQYSIRYPKPEYIVHSKIFLLFNPETNKKRVIVGSANFTQQAFNHTKQFEQILVFENETMFSLHQESVDEIRKHTLDYIPDILKKKPQGEEVTLVMMDQKDLVLQVLEERAKQGKTAGIIISEEIYQQLEQESKEAKDSIDIIDQNSRIIEVITQKKQNSSERVIITPKQLEKKKGKLKTIITPKYEKVEEKDIRPEWYMDRKNYYIYNKEEDQNEANLLSAYTSLDEIKKNINAIDNYIRSYEKFSILQTKHIQSKIYEAFLYTFFSPFLWVLREHAVLSMGGDTSQLRPYRPMMILAGKAASGKSNILEMCGRFLGYQGEKLISYPSLNNAGKLAEMFNVNKVSPILVDELSITFFAGHTGERETKRIANELYGTHPCMISATNADDFFVKAQLENRMYVLFIQNQFDEKRKKESIDTLNQIKESVSPFLFYDFSKRMADFLHNQENLEYIMDPLLPARELFLSYYKELNLDAPEYFPYKPFNDYFDRGSDVWRNLYEFKKEYFQIEKDFIIIHPSIAEKKEDRDKLFAFIPGHMIIENVGVYKLKKEAFLNFIGEKKKGWFQNWFK